MKPYQLRPETYINALENPEDMDKIIDCSHVECNKSFYLREGYVQWYWNGEERACAIFHSIECLFDAIQPTTREV